MLGHEYPLGDICRWMRIDVLKRSRVAKARGAAAKRPMGAGDANGILQVNGKEKRIWRRYRC